MIIFKWNLSDKKLSMLKKFDSATKLAYTPKNLDQVMNFLRNPN